MKVNFRADELPSAVVQSLRNIPAARKELLPLTINLSTAATLAFQIKLREISSNEIRAIRTRLERGRVESIWDRQIGGVLTQDAGRMEASIDGPGLFA